MPCYSVTPAYRRNVVHYNPFFQPVQHSFNIVPRFTSAPASLFRSFEEDLAQFDSFFKEVDASLAAASKKQPQSFQPRFDVKEESDRFILNGELPGVQPENLSIEFVNQNTMVVKGKVVRTETHGTPPAPAETQREQPQQVEQAEQASGEDVTMSGALADTASEASAPSSNYHKASVEDEDAGENATASSTTEDAATPAPTEDQVVKTAPQEVSKTAQPESHYWVSERTVGEFSRAFRFPGKINQDEVKASLKDGILNVAVPKRVEQDGRRKINVEA